MIKNERAARARAIDSLAKEVIRIRGSDNILEVWDAQARVEIIRSSIFLDQAMIKRLGKIYRILDKIEARMLASVGPDLGGGRWS
jgi:hypothetical protein